MIAEVKYTCFTPGTRAGHSYCFKNITCVEQRYFMRINGIKISALHIFI
jgi:hypothetical protein